MRKILSLLLCLTLVLGSAATAFADSFSDVPAGAYYYEPVYDLAWEDIIGGYPDGTFGPTKPITRAEIAVLLVNMLGLEADPSAAQRFSDVPSSHWAYGFIATAASEGFVGGYPNGTFQPNKAVSYDEALTMIVALLGYKAADLSGSYPTNFTNKAAQIGVMNTCSMTGAASATRANVACFIRDAVLILAEDPMYFRYVGPGYTVALGKDWNYYYTDNPSKSWEHTVLIIENTSGESMYVGLSSFDLYIDDVQSDFDTSEYYNNSEVSYPGSDLAPGKKMYVDLIYPLGKDYRKIDIYLDLDYTTNDEPVITLNRIME